MKPISDIKPARYIPEFDTGNIEEQEKLLLHLKQNKLLSWEVERLCELASVIVEKLIQRWQEKFNGRLDPIPEWIELAEIYKKIFLRKSKLTWVQNLDSAIENIWWASEDNTVVLQNHRSGLDWVIARLLLRDKMEGADDNIGFIASQVFEYCRPFSILTSGFRKYPVFPEKHIKTKQESVQNAMRRCNSATYRALTKDYRQWGQVTFIYPEIDRWTWELGAINPTIPEILKLMRKATKWKFSVVGSYIKWSEFALENWDSARWIKNPFDSCFANLWISNDIELSFGKPKEVWDKDEINEDWIKRIILETK